MEGLDLDIVAGRGLEGTLLLEGDWKGCWIWTLLMEGTLDPDVVAGRGFEGTLDPDIVDGRVVGSGRC